MEASNSSVIDDILDDIEDVKSSRSAVNGDSSSEDSEDDDIELDHIFAEELSKAMLSLKILKYFP